MKKYKSKGVKNFKFIATHHRLIGIYNYLARPKKSNVKSVEEANELIINFCKHELGFNGGLIRCTKRVNNNWDLFIKAIELR